MMEDYAEVKRALMRVQRGRCAYCGRSHQWEYLEVDHKHPVDRGGGDEFENLQLLCTRCNRRKGIQTDDEFRSRYDRLLPPDGSIPATPIAQSDFTRETQRTRTEPGARAYHRQRFERARQRQEAGCLLPIALVVGAVFVVAMLAVG